MIKLRRSSFMRLRYKKSVITMWRCTRKNTMRCVWLKKEKMNCKDNNKL